MINFLKAMTVTTMVMLLPAKPVAVQGQNRVNFGHNGFTFTVEDITKPDASATVTRTTKSGDIVIPPTAELRGKTYDVTNIASYFIRSQSNRTVTSITLPSTIKTIASGAFGASETLTEIKIQGENNAYTVQDGILYNKDMTELVYFPCKKDATGFNFPPTIKELSGDAFSNNILTSIIIPKHITILNDGGGEGANGIFGTFHGCKNLTSLTFERGENYTSIPSHFLSNSEKLTSFIIPETILRIGQYAFSDCKNLITQLPSELESIDRDAFQSCNALKEITFPKTLNSLGIEAFNNCGSLEKLTIPDDCVLTYISASCFRNNKNLRDVKLSNKIETIDNFAFEHCSSLPSIDLSQDLRTIGERAFSECRRLKDVKFYDKLETIHEGAFSRCSSLGDFTLPQSLKKIGLGAFHNTACKSVTIPSGVAFIEPCAFLQTVNLENFIVEPGNNAYTAIDGVLFTADKKTLLAYPAKSDRRVSYTVPAGVETIQEGALSYNSLTHITLPTSLETIYAGAFAEDKKLKELTVPANVKSIGKYNKNENRNYHMGNYGIISNSDVTSIYMLPATPPELDSPIRNRFPEFPKSTTVYLRKSVYDSNKYKNTNKWKNLTYAYEIPVKLPASGLKTMGRDFDVDLSNSTLTAYVAVNATAQNQTGNATMEPIKVAGKAEGKYVPARTGKYTVDNVEYEQYVGVILKGNGGEDATYRIGEEENLTPDPTQKNYLAFATDATKVTMTEMKSGVKYTNLGLQDGRFRYFRKNGTIAYNKCWLSMPTSIVGELAGAAGAKEFQMNFLSPTVNAITDIKPTDKASMDYYYNLQGVRIENPTSGIYIHNGKKIIIK